MPVTYPATARQIAFINDLRQERGMEPLDADTAARLTGGRTGSASRAITELQESAGARPAAAATFGRGTGTAVPAPSNANRAGRMLNGGGIDATVTLPSGDHVTLLISTRVPRGRGWANGAPGDEGARTKIKVLGVRVGWVDVENGRWTVTLRTSNTNIRDAVGALFAHAADQAEPGFRVQEASRCGRCRRLLTDPVSIDRGIGPECWGRCTGSHHAEVHTGGGDTSATDSSVLMAERDRIHDAEFARRERQQEEAAFASDPDYDALTTQINAELLQAAATRINTEAAARAHDPRVAQARTLIEQALKALVEDELATQDQARVALNTFDRLARGVQS